MDNSQDNNQVEKAKSLLVGYKKSVESYKLLPQGKDLSSEDFDDYWSKRNSLNEEQKDEQGLNPLAFYQSQIAVKTYGVEHCQYRYKSSYHTEIIEKQYGEICKQAIPDELYNKCRVDSTKHRYYEFIENDENVCIINSRHHSITKRQLRKVKLNIGLLLVVVGLGVVRLFEYTGIDYISTMSALAAFAIYYIYQTTYYKSSTWDVRFGGIYNPMSYLNNSFWETYNPHGQILSMVRSRQRERVASALNFYGLGDYDDMKISENGVMLYNRDKTSIRERLEKLKEALSYAEKGNMKTVECVQNSKKELIHKNFKEEGSILLKFMEIIIEREEMYDDLIKVKEAEALKMFLGEKVIYPDELNEFS
jgi:hypothetical protein